MSGYLEVKYPFKSNLGLNPFKSWKRQWCILRPSPTFSGGILAVYCSEAGASAGTIDLPSGFVVRRAKSRTRPHAFAVFPANEPRKPRVLLAAASLQDALNWMEKLRSLMNVDKLMDTDGLLKDSYSVCVNITEFSRKCGLSGADCTVTVSPSGVLVSRSRKLAVHIEWKHVAGVLLSTENDRNGTCIVNVDSEFPNGGGELHLTSPLASELVTTIRTGRVRVDKKLSKSEGDLRTAKCSDMDLGDVRRSSWYSGPSEVSLDDLDLVMSKDCKRIPEGQLSRCIGAGDLAPAQTADDSMSDRRSLASIASGIYEEISEEPPDDVYCKMTRDANFTKCVELALRLPAAPHSVEPAAPHSMKPAAPHSVEPAYECVGECVYGTTRRRPPPLPPRTMERGTTLSSSWRGAVSRTGSLGSLGGLGSLGSLGGMGARPTPALTTRTLPRWDRSRQAFSAFRKRLKSDSRTAISPKSENKEKDVETKKKKFDFTPSRDIFKSFKVSRKMKNLKITNKDSKSCEYLDETEHIATNRCSKSVECLEGNDEYIDRFNADVSIEFNDTVAALSLPQEIVQLLLNSHEKILNNEIDLRDEVEGDYMPMSPIVPPPTTLEHHYIVMSPRSNLA